jgi:hypothetical protein
MTTCRVPQSADTPYSNVSMPIQYPQDTWFEQLWPEQGSWVLLRGGWGYGPHNRIPYVFYVDQWLGLAPAGAPEAWQRWEASGRTPPRQPGLAR